MNIGCGEDVTIRELAETVCDVLGFQGELVFDTTKPDGTPRKLLDMSKLFSMVGNHAFRSVRASGEPTTGICNTVRGSRRRT